jgi:hypothetical protein
MQMSMETHIAELAEKHHALDAEIEAESERPQIDTLKISDLKKQKLRLKEEMERLQTAS